MELAIEVCNISKKYKLYGDHKDRLKEAFSLTRKKYHTDFYALEGVSFNVKRGETLGILGFNGSGKSTLLKIVTGVLTPTTGNVVVNGRISAMLELGAGFNPEYTGIENVYFNGTLMGMSKEDVDSKLDAIIKFADIGEFINQPVKNYSSGMFARLAFSVAINIEPDILIVDEILSVGDAFFQNKCFRKFEEFKKMGKTIIFVSHDIASVKQLCDRVIWLNKGKMMAIGDTDEVCPMYLNQQFNSVNSEIESSNFRYENTNFGEVLSTDQRSQTKYPVLKKSKNVGGNGIAEIMSFFITDSDEREVKVLEVDKIYYFHLLGKIDKNIKDAIFGFVIENRKGIQVFALNSFLSNAVLPSVSKGDVYEVVFKVHLPKIQKGTYLLSPAIASGHQKQYEVLTWHHNISMIEVINSGYDVSIMELESDVEVFKKNFEDLEFYNE